MAATSRGYLLLDAVAGWQAVLAGVAESGSERALSLEPLPGPAAAALRPGRTAGRSGMPLGGRA